LEYRYQLAAKSNHPQIRDYLSKSDYLDWSLSHVRVETESKHDKLYSKSNLVMPRALYSTLPVHLIVLPNHHHLE